jgi:hypothetical protein
VSPEAIGAILIALTGLVTAIGAIGQNRSRRIEAELAELAGQLDEEKKYSRRIARQLTLAERYITRLQRALSQADLDLPPTPEGFGDDHDIDAQPAPRRRNRHRAGDAPSDATA